jgi:hypothetical protein
MKKRCEANSRIFFKMYGLAFRTFFFIVLILFPLYGINSRYIDETVCDTADFSAISRALKDKIEDAQPDFPLVFIPQKERDSIAGSLDVDFRYSNMVRPGEASLKYYLLKSLVLLYQAEAGKKAVSAKALDILSEAAQNFPQRREVPWMRGLHQISAGNAFEGIRILDSLYASGFDGREFIADYARSVFHAFIPPRNKTIFLLLGTSGHSVDGDTIPVVGFSWRIIRSRRASLPFFDYDAGFVFRKPFRLVYPGMAPCRYPSAMLDFGDNPPQSPISTDLVNQLSDRTDSARCSIHIDVNDTAVSMFEYLRARINGIYDSIGEKKDLSQYNGISLRCYNRLSWIHESTCTAYIVFDRYYYDLMGVKQVNIGKNALKTALRRIRFTVTMRSGIDVQDKAEDKLQSILRAF